VKLTVLGCHGPYPPPGGACSGYLLREGECNLLIDCGNGVLSRLQEHMEYYKLDAVLLSHLHPDHISDIMIMRYALAMAENKGLRRGPLKLYAPLEPGEEFERLPYKNIYSVEPLAAEQPIKIGPFFIQTRATVHAVPGLAMSIQSSSGTLVYSGDTEFFEGLEKFVSGADLFLCEANFQEQDLLNNPANHLSASQAAMVAASAGAKRLLLTHHHPDRDRKVSITEAQKHYPAVEMAVEGETYIVGSSVE